MNEYLYTNSGVWVRNLCIEDAPFIDINNLVSDDEIPLLLANEIENSKRNHPDIEASQNVTEKVLIVSDGFEFEERHKLLASVPGDVTIIGVNKSLAKWKLTQAGQKRIMTYYVANNPYRDAESFLPKHNYWPRCIASKRTSSSFLRQYKGNIYLYNPTQDKRFSGLPGNAVYNIDDYRNPVCAAISIAYRMGARKIALFCCDDSFKDERPASVQLENGLWSYPQQIRSFEIMDAMVYWLNSADIRTANCSSGPKLINCEYIPMEGITQFFNE